MSEKIKQFLEADALRTQGEWKNIKATEDAFGATLDIVVVLPDGDPKYKCPDGTWIIEAFESDVDFMLAASRIAPDLAKMIDDLKLARKAIMKQQKQLRTLIPQAGIVNDELMALISGDEALARLKPYEKLFEKEGGE